MWGIFLLVVSAGLALAFGALVALLLRVRESAAFVCAVLLGSAAQLVLMTELLSLIGFWKTAPLLGLQLASLLAVAWIARPRIEPGAFDDLRVSAARLGPRSLLATASREPVAFAAIAFCCALLLVELVTAIWIAPNTWDSMTYHLSRIVYWMQDSSVMQFANAGKRQASFPINAEVLQGWTMLVSGGDRFAQVIQWFAQIGVIAGILVVGRDLGYRLRDRALAAGLFLAMPIAVAEGSSTQNDMVLAFFCLTALAFFVRAVGGDRSAAVLFALAAGLAFGTKSNAPMMLLAIGLAGLVVAGRNWRALVRPLAYAALAVVLLGSLNYGQNLVDRGSLLGSNIDQGFRVESAKQVPANAAEIAWVWGMSIPDWHQARAVVELENFYNTLIYDPLARIAGDDEPEWLLVSYSTIEHQVAGGLPLLLMLPALLWGLVRPRSRTEFAYALAAVLAFAIFVSTLLSNVWIGRFVLAPAALAAPLAARMMSALFVRSLVLVLVLIAIWTMGLQSVMKSVVLPQRTPLIEQDRIAQMTLINAGEAPMLRAVEKYVPAGSRLGIAPYEETWDYPYAGNHFQRTLVRLPLHELSADTCEKYDLDALLIYTTEFEHQKYFKPVFKTPGRQLIICPKGE
ncbi:MAG: glycosyltransferase family 39 protein [Solirubrobacterales bacterium]